MINKLFINTKKAKHNVLCFGSALIVLCIRITLLAYFIPSSIGKFDLTSNKMYTLGDISRETAESVSEDITVYLITSQENKSEAVETIISRYTRLNRKIKYDTLDPEADKAFIANYNSSIIEDNSVLIICEDRSRYIPYSAFFSYDTESYEYCYSLYTLYYQYEYISSDVTFAEFMMYFSPTLSLYDGYEYELQLTSAIKAVTSSDTKKLYILSGHDEHGISQDVSNRLGVNLFEVQYLNLNKSAIPSDANCILLTPTKDITESEYSALSEYLKNGGKLMLLSSYSDSESFENLLKLTSEFGLTTDFRGYLCEDDENYNSSSYQGLTLPDVSSAELADVLENHKATVMLGGSTGIKATQAEGITHIPLLTTSPQAYEKHITEDTQSLEFDEQTDTRAMFYTAIKAENSSNGSFVWISSESIIYDDYDPHCARGNKEAFIYLLNDLTENSGKLDIETKSVQTEIIDADAPYIYTVLCIFTVLAIGAITFGVIKYKKTK